MKRIILPLLLLLACFGATAGSLSDLFDEFKKYDDATYVRVPAFMMKFMNITGILKGVPMSGKVSGVKVLDLSDASSKIKNTFERRFGEEATCMDELVRVNDEGEKIRILTKVEKEKFRNLYIMATDGEDCSFIQLSGSFTKDDIDKIMKQASK